MAAPSVRRRLAVATWRPSRDGRIYTRMAVDAGPLLAYVERTRADSGQPVTLTHVIGAALGRVIRDEPEIRARVVLGRIRTFPSCDVGFAVDIAGGEDLAPVTVRAVDRKSPVEVAQELSSGAQRLRSGRDRAHSRSSRLVRLAPTFVLRPLLGLAGLFTGGLGIGAFGQPGFPLGAAFVSNVGVLGLEEAFVAPVPFARVPLYVAVGAVHDAAAVVDGRVVVRSEIVLTATADHRLIDGAHAGRVAKLLRSYLDDPTRLDETRAG